MDQPFTQFQSEAFRLELLQNYKVKEEQEAYSHFLKTGEYSNPFHSEWIKTIEGTNTRGAKISRVHVIQEPLSDYLKFEFKAYLENQLAGETIFILSMEQFQSLETGITKDFWLFDERFALEMNYSEQGKFLESEPQSSNLEKFVHTKDLVLKQAIPFREYLGL